MLQPLQPGATIGVIAPAFKSFTKPDLDRLTAILNEAGYNVIYGKSVNAEYGYLAGDDNLRANDVMEMFKNPEIAAILCIKGGYGAMRILDKLDYEIIKQNPKMVIGYSDITALQNAIYAKTSNVSIHGLVGISLLSKTIDDNSKEYFFKLLKGQELPSKPDKIDCEGVLIGGNLSLVSSLIGTPYMSDFKGKILMLEDVGEEPYAVDRMLTQLRLAGVFDQINGLILGHYTDCNPSESKKDCQTVEEVLDDFVKDIKVPVIRHYPFGHSYPFLSLPIGAYVYLDVRKNMVWWDQKTIFK